MINKFEAIRLLVGGNLSGNSDGTNMSYDDGQTPPTEKEIKAKQAEFQAEYDSKKYQRDRLAEYPTIQELVVALYDEEDKQAIIERRAAVKAKYPKPE